MSEDIDTRAIDIEVSRTEKSLLASFYLVDNGTKIELEVPTQSPFDEQVVAACMVQIFQQFEARNPDTSPMVIMAAMNKAVGEMIRG